VISDGQMPDIDGFMLARQIRKNPRLQRTPIVMLTSAAHPDDVARCRRIGIDAYLVKPVKHSDLLDALVTLFGVARRRPQRGAATRKQTRRSLRILVAEDNLVNRTLVTTLLRKRGHKVTAVENGRAAVETIDASTHGFDVALMDVQMPEMSGLDASEAIRHSERATGRRLPIVALTAHAMQGDRERCLDAGMDGYLSKPIDVDELVATVERFGGEQRPSPRAAGTPSSKAAPAMFDQRAALAHTGGDRRLLEEMIALFRSDSPSYVRRMSTAVKRHDGEALRMAAHGLKGALATVGSSRGRELCAELEGMGTAHRFADAATTLVRLRDHLKLLGQAFRSAGLSQ